MLLDERCAPATLIAPVKGKRCAADAAPLTGATRGGGPERGGAKGSPRFRPRLRRGEQRVGKGAAAPAVVGQFEKSAITPRAAIADILSIPNPNLEVWPSPNFSIPHLPPRPVQPGT
jgi:hypothetical protein